MPYIHIVTNTSIPDNTEEMLKTQLGRAIEILPGKNENWLMLNFTGDARLWFAGSDAPAALAEVSLYGGARSDAYDGNGILGLERQQFLTAALLQKTARGEKILSRAVFCFMLS